MGRRGREGELTVRVASGNAERWTGLKRVLVGRAEGTGGSGARAYRVAACRAYRDRLVLKLEGVVGAGEAASLAGLTVSAPPEDVPALPEGEFYVARLVGMDVVDSRGAPLGKVVDVVTTGGCELLSVDGAAGGEILIPLARAIVKAVDEERGRIVVELPEGLERLNAQEDRA